MKTLTLFTNIYQRQKLSYISPFPLGLLLLYLLLQANFTQAQWTRKQDAFKNRSEVTSVVYKDKFYTFIGFGAFPEVESSSEVYDPVQDKWTLLASMPVGKTVTHQGVVRIDDKVWHIGGRVGTNPGPLTSEVWIYDLVNDSWQAGPQLKDPATGIPLPWAGGGAALLGRTLHVFGGFINDACNNDQDKYHLTLDVDKWLSNPQSTPWENKLAPMPIKRNHFGTTVLGGKIYALGGQFGHDCGGGSDQKYSHVYNPVTDSWTKLTDMPTPRSHIEGSVFPLDGKIYIVAGQGGSGINQNRVTVLTPEANGGLGSWADASDYALPNAYEGIASKVIGNTFIISHGGQGSSSKTQKTTYTANLTRTIPYKLGFVASCYTRTIGANQKIVLKNLLYTLEGEKQYSLSSNANWLRITKNASGLAVQTAVDIEAVIDATGLEAGNYTATVTATGSGAGPSYSSASFCVNLTVVEAQSSVLVNAGGGTYTDNSGRSWGADAYFTGGVTSSKSFDVAGTTDDQLYLKYRYAYSSSSSTPGAPFSYNIPVSEAGSYTLKLHLFEPYFKKTGGRVFHVDVEGKRVLSNYDIYAQHGFGKAVVLTFEGISVTDGTANIIFNSVTNNAIISGVELEKSSTAPSYMLTVKIIGSGSVTKDPDQNLYPSGTNVLLTATPASGYRFTGWSGAAIGTVSPLSVIMDGNKSVTATFESISTNSSALVNTGGGTYTDNSGRSWGADAYFTGGVTSSKSFDVAGTTDDQLYLKYRYAYSSSSSTPGAPFSYNIPVSEAGSYTLRLHFVEPYFGAPGGKTSGLTGARVFHVDVEGKRVISNYDIYTEDGAAKAIVKTFSDVTVSDGTLNITFVSVKNNAIISAIEVERNSSATATASIGPPEAEEQSELLVVYPNPNTGKSIRINVTGFDKHEMLILSINDITGRLLHSETTLTNELGESHVELLLEEGLQKGVYIVKTEGLSGKRQSKLVVQ